MSQILAQENFDSYSNNQSLVGLNGGIGFTSAWSVAGAAIVSNGFSVWYPLSALLNNGSYCNASRQHAPFTKFMYSFRIRTNASSYPEFLSHNGTNSFRLQFTNDSNKIKCIVNANTIDTGKTWQSNTTYKIDIYIDLSTNTFKIYIDDVLCYSISNYSNNGAGFYEMYLISPGSSNASYFDDIYILDYNEHDVSFSDYPKFFSVLI